MSVINQQSSILSEQELQLLAFDSNQPQQTIFTVYSYQYNQAIPECRINSSNSLEQLILMLTASPHGVAVLLADDIELEPGLAKLISLLTHRADIRVFWLGALPSMDTNLPDFIHCIDEWHLVTNVLQWKNYITRTFSEWLAHYSVAFITEGEKKKIKHQQHLSSIGLRHVEYFTAQAALSKLKNQKLLIIDIDVFGLRLIEILKGLAHNGQFPIIIIYGQRPNNVCRATYTLIENKGFPILASLSEIPNKAQWHKLLFSLFSKVYLKLWVNEEQVERGSYPIYNLLTESVSSYFFSYGIRKKQIAKLQKTGEIRHIINVRSLQDWFSNGIKREMRSELARDLNCEQYSIDICIEYPENIQQTSILFSILVMARLSNAKIYWLVENEHSLLTGLLINFPISDVILSESLSHMLITDPSDVLLDFLEQAQKQQVQLIATLQPSRSTNEALALYGIESVLNKQRYIE
jgi:hypothetical protein